MNRYPTLTGGLHTSATEKYEHRLVMRMALPACRRLPLMCVILLGFVASVFPQTVRIGIYANPPHMDSTQGDHPIIGEIIHGNVLEGLTALNADNEIVPLLAESWTCENDMTACTFAIKPNVAFHDGEPVNAKNAIYSLYRYQHYAEAHKNTSNYLKNVSQIYAKDERTIVFKSHVPLTGLPAMLATPDLAIVSPESAVFLKSEPIGTGPYVFSVRESKTITLEVNTAYHATLPRIKRIEYRIMLPSQLYDALKTDKIDGVPFFPFPDTAADILDGGKFRVDVGMAQGKVLLAMNPSKKPFNRLRVRKAVAHALNKQDFADTVFHGMLRVRAYAPKIGDDSAIDASDPHPFGVARAKKLLRISGYRNGFGATLLIPPSALAEKTAHRIVSQLKKIGVTLRIKKQTWKHWQMRVFRKKTYAMAIIPVNDRHNFNMIDDANYLFNYDSQVIEDIFKKLVGVTNPTTVQMLEASIRKKSILDAVNVFLFQIPKISVWKKNYAGYPVDALIHASPFNTLSYSPSNQ